MEDRQPNMLTRDDTFFGVCQALGEDFGFPPNILRVLFGVPAIMFPGPVLTLYFGLGAIVLISRLLAPSPRRKAAMQAEAATSAPEAANEGRAPALLAEADADQFALPMAA